MRIAQINMTPFGSTGRIMLQIAETARKSGMDAHCYTTELYSKKRRKTMSSDEFLSYYGSYYNNMIHNYVGKLLGKNGCLSYFGTRQLVKMLKEFSPDVVHLHNLHNYCINLPLLFRYLKKSNVKVVWTLHDCWTFTGHCPHFDMLGCDKWKTGCYKCGQLRQYPKSYVDTSKSMYRKKKQMFTSVENMILVTPSQWLAELVKESYLKDFTVKVIHNGIDTSVFKPTESDFRKKHNLQDKKIVLAVAFGWGVKKGLDVILKLSEKLSDDYRMVLVGTNDELDKSLPDNIVSIHRTNNQNELAEIYSASDVFINATREDTFPTVNIEALACGTPVITFKTGGSPESLDETCGSVVEKEDVDGLKKEIVRICSQKPYSEEACVLRGKKFVMQDKFREYVQLYEEICKK